VKAATSSSLRNFRAFSLVLALVSLFRPLIVSVVTLVPTAKYCQVKIVGYIEETRQETHVTRLLQFDSIVR